MNSACGACRNGEGFPLPFSMAFQPIVNLNDGAVFAYEALVRGADGAGAGSVLGLVTPENRYVFDQQCRVKAIELASALALPATEAVLSINFLPNAVYEPRACIRLTLSTASRLSFPLNRLMFEFTENEALDTAHVSNIVAEYRDMGFKTALDDFGAGYAGLGLLTRIKPDVVKLDMELIRGIDADPTRRIILRSIIQMLTDLGIQPVCEGVETSAELDTLRDLGVVFVQGYFIARPGFEQLPAPFSAHGMAARAD